MSPMMRPVVIVMMFAILMMQAIAGWLDSLAMGHRFVPIRGAVWVTDRFFVQPFGHLGGAALLAVIGAFLAWLSYRQARA